LIARAVAIEISLEAIDRRYRLRALEALPVDPVYSGKGLAGLIALVRAGRWQPDTDVIFIHTGGAPALFAYQSVLGI
jgi:L-cysteate sulfo-lyase